MLYSIKQNNKFRRIKQNTFPFQKLSSLFAGEGDYKSALWWTSFFNNFPGISPSSHNAVHKASVYWLLMLMESLYVV